MYKLIKEDPLYNESVSFTKVRESVSVQMVRKYVRISEDRATAHVVQMQEDGILAHGPLHKQLKVLKREETNNE